MSSNAAASCHGVVRIYWSESGEVHALKGIDAEFAPGTVTAIVGPSGSGKSSLLRILACVDRPTAGQVSIGGQDVTALPAAQRRRIRRGQVGYVFQRPAENLLPYLTVRDHLLLAARLRGRVDNQDTAHLLDVLELADRAGDQAHELSGGEQQRLAFANAVIGGPALVLADEPTAELDSATGEALMATVAGLKERGTSFVITTHDPVVMGNVDRTLFLRHGTLEAESDAGGAVSVLDATGRIQLPPEALRLFPDRRAVVRIEDGEIRITPP
jgi:putative ABC transport system ATP-binding protein